LAAGIGFGRELWDGPMKILRRQRHLFAFTLLEVMVAFALLAIIVMGIYSSWYAITKGTRTALEASAAAQRTRIAMRTVQDALVCSCMYAQNARYYSFTVDNDGDISSLSFVARLPRSFPRSGKFGDLTTRRVSFTVEDGPDYSKQLVLRQNPILMDPDEDEVQHPLVLAHGVKMFLVEFPDPRSGEWITDWVNTNQLPKVVRVSLALNAGRQDDYGNKVVDTMVGTVAIPGQPVRLEWQMPPGQLNAPNLNGTTNQPTPNGGNPAGAAGGNPNTVLKPGGGREP
jgi:type II secretory pathway pseudopilin PulG